MGSSFVKNSNEGDVIASTVLSLLLLAIPALLFMPAWLSMGDKVAIVSAALIASVIVGWVMSKVAQRNFGCVNGDVLGATNEISKVVVLLAILAVVHWL